MNRTVALSLVAALAGCGEKPAPNDDFSELSSLDPKSDAFSTSWRIVGSLAYGQTSPSTSYSNPPKYRAFTFLGATGDQIIVDAHSAKGDTVAWVLDSTYKTLATNDDASSKTTDSHIELTLPKSASATHYIVVRDYNYAAMTFTVALRTKTPPPPTTTLTLVSARDHIAGNFLTNRAVYADARHIYLASIANDQLFVLNRDRAANFPLVQTLSLGAGITLSGVRGDGQRVYVSASDGKLHVYDGTKATLSQVAAWPIADNLLGQPAIDSTGLYVAHSQGAVAVGGGRVFVSELNEGDGAVFVTPATGAKGRTYGDVFEANVTVAFDEATGARLGAITNPLDNRGLAGSAVLFADDTMLAQTIAGCCGTGVRIYDPKTLQLKQQIARSWINTVARRGNLLVAGNEGGQVELYDLTQNPPALVAAADLRLLTNHTGSEDIEIRGLWTDATDGLVFAGSSWGNDSSRGPTLPSFFVLEVVSN